MIRCCNSPLSQTRDMPMRWNALSTQILDGGPEVCGVDAAVLATRVAFAAIQSARDKRPVLLEDLGNDRRRMKRCSSNPEEHRHGWIGI